MVSSANRFIDSVCREAKKLLKSARNGDLAAQTEYRKWYPTANFHYQRALNVVAARHGYTSYDHLVATVSGGSTESTPDPITPSEATQDLNKVLEGLAIVSRHGSTSTTPTSLKDFFGPAIGVTVILGNNWHGKTVLSRLFALSVAAQGYDVSFACPYQTEEYRRLVPHDSWEIEKYIPEVPISVFQVKRELEGYDETAWTLTARIIAGWREHGGNPFFIFDELEGSPELGSAYRSLKLHQKIPSVVTAQSYHDVPVEVWQGPYRIVDLSWDRLDDEEQLLVHQRRLSDYVPPVPIRRQLHRQSWNSTDFVTCVLSQGGENATFSVQLTSTGHALVGTSVSRQSL